jgi:hypothetical protein
MFCIVRRRFGLDEVLFFVWRVASLGRAAVWVRLRSDVGDRFQDTPSERLVRMGFGKENFLLFS